MRANKMLVRLGAMLLVLLFLSSCAASDGVKFDQAYGKPVPKEYVPVSTQAISYYGAVRPLLEQRCVVCHGCYDAPCQLKLDSYQGLIRGANPEKVYDGTRLLGASMSRLFEDAHSTAAWRDKGFHPVLNEFVDTPFMNLDASALAQMLLLKEANPLPQTPVLSDDFDFSLDNKQVCTRAESFKKYAKEHPLLGMPYGLPGLSQPENTLMLQWLKEGAQSGKEPELPSVVPSLLQQWEVYLNGDSLKQQLASRYIFEHLFLAQLYFEEVPGVYFRLVRSKTPPGQPLERISTTRPFDDPGVGRVYYRFWQDPSSLLAKTYMPYVLNAERMRKWDKWFFAAPFVVTRLPSYQPETASNPFVSFADLPIASRYRFMLDEAQFTIANFIKGPVCRGQVALNVIQDHFWVFFLTPESQSGPEVEKFIAENSRNLRLPAEKGNTALPLTNWIKYSELQQDYLRSKADFISSLNGKQASDLSLIWDGDGQSNPNAALTIFRHSDSASVRQGLIGDPPKTAWVIGYPLLERIHYLLVAGFDVYGNVSHQLLSRLYMDFLRMEGEMTFLEFLPPQVQEKEIDAWYQGAEGTQKKYIDVYQKNLRRQSTLVFAGDNPKLDFYRQLQMHLGPVAQSPYNLKEADYKPSTWAAYQQLHTLKGLPVSLLPQVTVIHIPELGYFSLLHHNDYRNLSSLFNEDKRHQIQFDNLTLVKGIIGSYPNSFMQVAEVDFADFVAQISQLKTEEDYTALRNRYAIRRTNPAFWKFSDDLLDFYRKTNPKEAGLLDYNRMENR